MHPISQFIKTNSAADQSRTSQPAPDDSPAPIVKGRSSTRRQPARQVSLIDLMQKLVRRVRRIGRISPGTSGSGTATSPQDDPPQHSTDSVKDIRETSPDVTRRACTLGQTQLERETPAPERDEYAPRRLQSANLSNTAFATLKAPLPDTAALHDLLHSTVRMKPTGLQESHLQTLLGLCREFNLILGIRPVSALAGYLISDLTYPTKPYAIKAKSLRHGPAAGHIGISEENEDTQTAIRNGHAIELPLLLTGERIIELLREGLLDNVTGNPPISKQSSNSHVDLLTLKCSLTRHAYRFKRLQTGTPNYLSDSKQRGGIWAVQQVVQGGTESAAVERTVNVLGHPRLGKPYTADYDLLSFGFYSPLGSSPLNTLPPINVENSLMDLAIARRRLSGTSRNLANADPRAQDSLPGISKEDPQWGNASPLLRCIAESINACINRGSDPDLRLVHHNADCHNPFSNEQSIYPALFLLPNPVAMPIADLLEGARPDAIRWLEKLRKLQTDDGWEPGEIGWHNWGAVWIDNPVQFNQLARTANQHGYVIKKSQAWVGGEVLPATNSTSDNATGKANVEANKTQTSVLRSAQETASAESDRIMFRTLH
jgi:hypothetical protein